MRGIGLIAVVGLFVICSEAQAQFWPGYGYQGYGAWGGYASAVSDSTNRYIAEQDRLQGERAAMGQAAVVQGGIRRTLTNQAEARTQGIINQQQANRDWWFQTEQQQMAQRQSVASRPMFYAVPAAGFESQPVAAQPAAATDIIPWVLALREPQFAAERAIVEAPYRREPKSAPIAADYQAMIDAVAKMKTTLDGMTSQISAQEYLTAQKFLDQLAAEAHTRLEKK